jgi:DNA-binding CsgD family transcriptional regulator
MGQGRNPFRHTGWLSLRNELVRGALSAVLLLILWIAGLPLLLVLLLPIMAYAGLWLLTGASPSSPVGSTPSPREIRTAHDECIRLKMHIDMQCGAIVDPRTRQLVQQISTRVDEIMRMIDEDRHPEIHLKLLEPLSVTDNFLSNYAKLLRRGHDPAEMKERVRANLTSLDGLFDRIRQELIDEAVIDLGKLSDEIEKTIEQLPVPADVPTLPPVLPESVAHSLPTHIAAMIDSLTPRQLTILRILPTGKTDQEIGDMLFISKRTVTTHLTEIYARIQVRNRAEAVAFAVRWGLAPSDEPETTPTA